MVYLGEPFLFNEDEGYWFSQALVPELGFNNYQR
jgi:hypothetical protein